MLRIGAETMKKSAGGFGIAEWKIVERTKADTRGQFARIYRPLHFVYSNAMEESPQTHSIEKGVYVDEI